MRLLRGRRVLKIIFSNQKDPTPVYKRYVIVICYAAKSYTVTKL